MGHIQLSYHWAVTLLWKRLIYFVEDSLKSQEPLAVECSVRLSARYRKLGSWAELSYFATVLVDLYYVYVQF